jgi:hypothetical protein
LFLEVKYLWGNQSAISFTITKFFIHVIYILRPFWSFEFIVIIFQLIVWKEIKNYKRSTLNFLLSFIIFWNTMSNFD